MSRSAVCERCDSPFPIAGHRESGPLCASCAALANDESTLTGNTASLYGNIVRVDDAHSQSSSSADLSDHSQTDPEAPITHPAVPVSSRVRSAIVFGVFVFLCGQIIQFLGFVAGQFTIWAVGNLCTIGGICFALLSVAEAFRRNQLQLDQLMQQDVKKSRRRRRTRRFISSR